MLSLSVKRAFINDVNIENIIIGGCKLYFWVMEREGIKFALSQLAMTLKSGPFIVMVLLKIFF